MTAGTAEQVPSALPARSVLDDLIPHREHLFRVAYVRTRNRDDAADVVSEALLRVGELGREVRDPVAWTTRVVINLCADLYRGRTPRAAQFRYWASLSSTVPSAEDEVCRRVNAAVFHLATLPPRQQELLLLMADGHDLRSVAERLDVSYKATESLLSRARATLRAAAVDCAATGQECECRLVKHAIRR